MNTAKLQDIRSLTQKLVTFPYTLEMNNFNTELRKIIPFAIKLGRINI